eukprot:m.71083 g.71083  ORF g.71083 m.71083 type:complete len:166 (+) comp12206_c1_seq2:566-1063(+)
MVCEGCHNELRSKNQVINSNTKQSSQLCFDSTLPDIRRGMCFFGNCTHLGWSNFDLRFERKISEIYQDGYPIKLNAIYLMNTPTIIRAMLKLASVFLKKKIRDRMNLIKEDDLWDYFSPENVPEVIGGEQKVNGDQFVRDNLAQRVKTEEFLKETYGEYFSKLRS